MKESSLTSLAVVLVTLSFSSAGVAEPSQTRHTGTYNLDYSYQDHSGMFHEDYLIGSIHGAIAYMSSWGNGATSFHYEFPLVPINDEMRADIEEARDGFIEQFNQFVDDGDWQFNWFGKITYFNVLIKGKWTTEDARDAEKAVLKDDGRAYAEATVENAIANWNLLFENLPQTVHVDAAYGQGCFEPVGMGTFYFDGDEQSQWISGMVHNARLTLPYIVPQNGFLEGTQLPEGQLLGLGCLTWMAADEIGCFELDAEEPCICETKDLCADDGGLCPMEDAGMPEETATCSLDEGTCANQCVYLDETVDSLSLAGMIGELTCVGTVPGIIFGFDVGYGMAGFPRGTLQ
jgi:hypothetical protein